MLFISLISFHYAIVYWHWYRLRRHYFEYLIRHFIISFDDCHFAIIRHHLAHFRLFFDAISSFLHHTAVSMFHHHHHHCFPSPFAARHDITPRFFHCDAIVIWYYAMFTLLSLSSLRHAISYFLMPFSPSLMLLSYCHFTPILIFHFISSLLRPPFSMPLSLRFDADFIFVINTDYAYAAFIILRHYHFAIIWLWCLILRRWCLRHFIDAAPCRELWCRLITLDAIYAADTHHAPFSPYWCHADAACLIFPAGCRHWWLCHAAMLWGCHAAVTPLLSHFTPCYAWYRCREMLLMMLLTPLLWCDYARARRDTRDALMFYRARCYAAICARLQDADVTRCLLMHCWCRLMQRRFTLDACRFPDVWFCHAALINALLIYAWCWCHATLIDGFADAVIFRALAMPRAALLLLIMVDANIWLSRWCLRCRWLSLSLFTLSITIIDVWGFINIDWSLFLPCHHFPDHLLSPLPSLMPCGLCLIITPPLTRHVCRHVDGYVNIICWCQYLPYVYHWY